MGDVRRSLPALQAGGECPCSTGFGTCAPVLASEPLPPVRAGRLLLPPLGIAWFAEP